MGFKWTRTPTAAFDNAVQLYADAIRAGVFAIAQRYAGEIEAYMKDNAIWTDRTANARQTMAAEAFQLADMARIVLAHGMEYGVYLELANGGAFAIIGPTIDVFGPRIWADVQELMR